MKLNHVAAMWEVFWMVFHDQPRKTTIRRIIALGFSARDAIEMVQDAEKEGNDALP